MGLCDRRERHTLDTCYTAVTVLHPISHPVLVCPTTPSSPFSGTTHGCMFLSLRHVEQMLIVSTTRDPCNSLVWILGLEGDLYKADLCTSVCNTVIHRKVTSSIMTEVLRNDSCTILCCNYSSHLFEKPLVGALGMCCYALLCYYRLNHWSRLCVNDRTGTFCSLASSNFRDCWSPSGLQQAKRMWTCLYGMCALMNGICVHLLRVPV